MRRNQELVDFEADPATSKAHVIDASAEGDELLASIKPDLPDRDAAISLLARKRAVSPLREDKDDILTAFGAKSSIDLAMRGHGLSLSDQFWYRAPGSTERWEDINFFDNEWDPSFGAAVFRRDYAGLASCSPETPDATTCGRAVKTWERRDDGIFLIKESRFPDGYDLVGAKLTADLCARLFDEGSYINVDIVERYGKRCLASSLMLASDEELADGNRLRAMAGMQEEPGKSDGDRMTAELLQSVIEAYAAVGIADASAHIARMACCFCLSFITDFHSGNFGVIRKVGTDTWRPAPLFDFEGSYGIAADVDKARVLLANPSFAGLYCASRFSFLDRSWDWSWYDPRVLEGFEDRIEEALASIRSLPPEFSSAAAGLFAMQRAYVGAVASARA